MHVIELKNDLGELPRLADELQAFAAAHRLPDAALLAMNLALEELVTNTISYGYADGQAHVIAVSLNIDGPDLHLRVEDDARPFNPLELAAPNLDAPIAERPVGGLGIHLVRSMMDDVSYERAGSRNVVSMRKRVADAASPKDKHHGHH